MPKELKPKNSNVSANGQVAINQPLQQIFYGAPGTGKSYAIKEVVEKYPNTIRTTFHPDSDYSTFVGVYKPTTTMVERYGLHGSKTIAYLYPEGEQKGQIVKESRIEYKFVKQAFLKAYIKAWRFFLNGVYVYSHKKGDPDRWLLYSMDDRYVYYTKETKVTLPKYEKLVKTFWEKMLGSKKPEEYPIPNASRDEATACTWYRDNNKKDFMSKNADDCWNSIIVKLNNGETIDDAPTASAGRQNGRDYQSYSISLKGNIIIVTSKNKTVKNKIIKFFRNNTSKPSASVEYAVAKKLEEYGLSFNDAWNKLKEVIGSSSVQKTSSFDSNNVTQQYLVIEEINRGNCAQIFGDLFQLLDRKNGFSEYPIEADEDIRKALLEENPEDELSFGKNGLQLSKKQIDYINNQYKPVQNVAERICQGQVLVLPPNLYIWATMNTSDQSLFPIDSAFKRRWDWQYVPIANANLGWKIEINGKHYDWWDFLEKINALIGSTTNSEDKKLGYFFCNPADGIITADTFVSKVIFYLWNDVFKDFEFDNEVFNDVEKASDGKTMKLTFDKFYGVIKGKPVVRESKIEVFLSNLGMTSVPVAHNTEDNDTIIGFSLDGNPMTRGDIAKSVVFNYAQINPSMSAQEIRDFFIDLCSGVGASHIVETEAEYHSRDGQKSQKRSVSEITIPHENEKLYVSTQWRTNGNFLKFMKIINDNGLGVITPLKNEDSH